jgi:Skp family chaperone for outer membrane proteins
VYVLEGGIPESPAEAVPVEMPVSSSSAADVLDTESGSQDAPEKTCAGSDALSGGSAAYDEELALLRAENAKLLAEIKESQSVEARMTEQIEQQRGELCESAEKLSSLYAQVQSDTLEMRLMQDQYAALQEQHADVVGALKLEIEQLYKQSGTSQSGAEASRDEDTVLERSAQS